MISNDCTENKTGVRGSSGLPPSITQLEAKRGTRGAASSLPPPMQLRQPFPTLKMKVAGVAFMGFPWGRMEGQVVVEAEGREFRQ